MSKPLFLADNLFDDVVQYPDHTVTANEESTNGQAWRVATGRREPQLDYWTPTTANNAAWVRVECDTARDADLIVIDRGHNLGGVAVTLERSTDGSTWTTVTTATIPTSTSSSGSVTDTNGVLTEEGAWLKAFTSASDVYWRVSIAAMGAGLKPIVYGVWLGERWDPDVYFTRPFGDDDALAQWQHAQTSAGWRATGRISTPKSGEAHVKLDSFTYADARVWMDLYRAGNPAWFIPDRDAAERAFLAMPPAGSTLGFRYQTGWGYRQAQIPYYEHEVAPR